MAFKFRSFTPTLGPDPLLPGSPTEAAHSPHSESTRFGWICTPALALGRHPCCIRVTPLRVAPGSVPASQPDPVRDGSAGGHGAPAPLASEPAARHPNIFNHPAVLAAPQAGPRRPGPGTGARARLRPLSGPRGRGSDTGGPAREGREGARTGQCGCLCGDNIDYMGDGAAGRGRADSDTAPWRVVRVARRDGDWNRTRRRDSERGTRSEGRGRERGSDAGPA